MVKKVIDIIPPKEVKKINKEKAKQLLPKSNFFGSKTNLYSDNKLSFILSFLILLGVFFYVYFALPRAEIKIWLETEILTTEIEVVIGEEISGQILEFEETINQSFPVHSSLLKETKAEGIIRVYNNYSTSPVRLVARTRFKSACGKEFHTPVAISIPGKYRDVPGSLDVEVIANRTGNESNIEATAFSIPGLRGTALFTTVTGRSYKPMTGGEIKEVGIVSQEDLNLAEKLLKEIAINGCLNKLRDYQGFYISEELIDINILESFANEEVGAKITEFNFQVKANCRTVGFKEEEIKKFALNYLDNKIIKEKSIVPESLKVNYSLKNKDINQEKMTLSLALTAKTYLTIDEYSIKKQLTNRTLSGARGALEGWSGISRVDVEFWPFWVELVPENPDKVKIKVKFD